MTEPNQPNQPNQPKRLERALLAAAVSVMALAMAGFADAPSAVTGEPPGHVDRSPSDRRAELKKRQPKAKPAEPAPPTPPPAPVETPQPAAPSDPAASSAALPAPERIEADISTHTVAVTSVFKGTEIVVFGTVLNSRQLSAEQGYYDIVVSIEGRTAPALVRLKSRMAGMWLNTRAIRFDGLPIYLAIASTRPPAEIAEVPVLASAGIGYLRARMIPGRGVGGLAPAVIDDFKSAFQRLKEKDGLYVQATYGVGFVGRSLFRASIRLPANIPVGPLTARTYLFHDGRLLATQNSSVSLRRSGLERLVYDFAYDYPIVYAALAILFACATSLLAAFLFRRPGA